MGWRRGWSSAKICRSDFGPRATLTYEIGEYAIDNGMASPLTSARSG